MTVFKFNIWYIGDKYEDMQVRYVIAETEDEAIKKLEDYREKTINDGFADFTWAGGTVEIENVIA